MPLPSRSFLVAPVALLGVASLLASCGGDDAAATTTTTTTTVPRETTTTEDAREAVEAEVIAAYVGQWEDFVRAGDPPTPDAPFLADHQTGGLLAGTRNILGTYEAEGIVMRGTYETNPVVSKLTDATAVIEDCGLDQLQLVQAATDTIVQESDDEPDGLRVELVLEGGAWKAEHLEKDDSLCEE